MPTVREGHAPVWMVVDVQVGVMAEARLVWLACPGRRNGTARVAEAGLFIPGAAAA